LRKNDAMMRMDGEFDGERQAFIPFLSLSISNTFPERKNAPTVPLARPSVSREWSTAQPSLDVLSLTPSHESRERERAGGRE
jgi:hypothetical protein